MWLDSKAVNCPQKWGNFNLTPRRQVYNPQQFGAHPAKASDNNTVQAFRYKGSPGVEKDQDRLAGSELRDG